MDPAGNADPRGPREFIVGTGGESLDTLNPSAPNVQASSDQYYGVAKFALGDGWCRWDYESALESPAARQAPGLQPFLAEEGRDRVGVEVPPGGVPL